MPRQGNPARKGGEDVTATPQPVPLFAVAADRYRDAGWAGVLPIPARQKASPPSGFTGDSGAYPTEVQLNAWARGAPDANIALRMPPDVIGIDVDAYGTKLGGTTLTNLEAELGPLPCTWVSTSRDDGVSGIRFYRIPAGTKLIGALPGIEIIQRHHRYAVVAPSIHPEGRQYRWIDPDGDEGRDVAYIDDLPKLPNPWVEHLRADRHTTAQRRVLATGQQEPSQAVDRALGAAARQLTAGTRHDAALAGVTALTRLAHEGHPGADQALVTLERQFLTAVAADGSRNDREAAAEWARMVDSADQLVATTPSTRPHYSELSGGDSFDPRSLIHPGPAPVDVDHPWPTPDPLPTSPPPPAWDRTVLPAWMQAHIDNIATQIHCAPDLPAMFALGALSAAALGHIQVEARAGHTEHPALYLVVPAPPSEGKSAALEMVMAPIVEHEERMIEAAADDVAEAETRRKIAEKRVRTLEETAANTGDPAKATEAATARAQLASIEVPPEGRLTTSDVTPERLATLMAANNERMAIVSDESGVLAIDRYGDKRRGSNLDLYLQAWSGRRVTVDRQTAPSVRLRRPLLSIVVGAQPEAWAAALADDEFRTRGLGARFMSATPTPRGHQRNIDLDRDQWDPNIAATYRQHLGALAAEWATWRMPATITLSRDAKRTWTTWGQPMQTRMGPGGDLAHEAGWVSKMRDSVIRVAALLHLADGRPHSDPVAGDVMARACRLGDYWTAHRTHETHDEWAEARKLLRTLTRIAADTDDGLVTRELIRRKGSKGLRTIEEIARPVADLVELGQVRMQVDLPPGLRADPLGLVRAMVGLKVHPTIVEEARRRLPGAGTAQPRPTASPTNLHDTQPLDHAESTFRGQVVKTAYKAILTPSPPKNRLPTEDPEPPTTQPRNTDAERQSPYNVTDCPDDNLGPNSLLADLDDQQHAPPTPTRSTRS